MLADLIVNSLVSTFACSRVPKLSFESAFIRINYACYYYGNPQNMSKIRKPKKGIKSSTRSPPEMIFKEAIFPGSTATIGRHFREASKLRQELQQQLQQAENEAQQVQEEKSQLQARPCWFPQDDRKSTSCNPPNDGVLPIIR